MITCEICQHENPEGAEYCEDCGAALPSSTTPASSPASQPVPANGGAQTPLAAGGGSLDAAAPASEAPQADIPPATAPQTAPLTAAPDQAAGEAPSGAMDAGAQGATPPAQSAAPAPAAAPTTSPGAQTGANPRLVAVRYGAATGEPFPLLGTRMVVGRFDPETGPVDIDLSQVPESQQISRHHAEIYRETDGSWYVKDMGSTNGVFVKSSGSATFGPRLTAPQQLTNGDEVAFGNARFIFQVD